MNFKKLTIMFVVLFFCGGFDSVQASIIDYKVTGTAKGSEGSVTGNIWIDDQPFYHDVQGLHELLKYGVLYWNLTFSVPDSGVSNYMGVWGYVSIPFYNGEIVANTCGDRDWVYLYSDQNSLTFPFEVIIIQQPLTIDDFNRGFALTNFSTGDMPKIVDGLYPRLDLEKVGPVPEPGTLLLITVGLFGFAGIRMRT